MTIADRPGLSKAVRIGGTSLIDGYVGHLKTFRRAAYAKTSGLDATILYAEDRDFVYKLEEVTSFVFIDQPLYKHRQVPHSQSMAPEKRRIGIQNHRRAYEQALQRRQIRGLQQWMYRIYFQERYAGQRVTPAWMVPAGHRAKQFLWRL